MNHNKIIHLTCKDKNNIDNKVWINCLNEYKRIYKDYKIKIYDNNDIYNIVLKYYPKYYKDIKCIKIGAILADIFRYLILYLKGGIYSDFDCMPLKHINSLFKEKYFHGNHINKDNLIYIYDNVRTHQPLKQESVCDYYKNPCDNCELVRENNQKKVFKCLGHDYSKLNNNKVICCYEFVKYNQICQWFIISEAKQKVFLQCFLQCMKNIEILKNLDKTKKDYNDIVMKNSGPELFSKFIKIYKKKHNNILILPETYFCAGSGNVVPITKYSVVKHCFTSSWR